MAKIRAIMTGHWQAALLLLAVVLLVRALVPSGYMFASHDGVFSVELCDGMVVAPAPAAEPAHDMAMAHGAAMAMHHHSPHHEAPAKQPVKGEMPCAFSAVNISSAMDANPVLPIAAIWLIAMALAYGRRVETPIRVYSPHHLRPLLRAPPAR